jgi:hypothetical protein
MARKPRLNATTRAALDQARREIARWEIRFTPVEWAAFAQLCDLLAKAHEDPVIKACPSAHGFVEYLWSVVADRGLEMVQGEYLAVLKEVSEASLAERNRAAGDKANAVRRKAALNNRESIDAMVKALPVGTTKKAAARLLEKDGAGSFSWLYNLFSKMYPGNAWPPKHAAKSQPAPGSVER